MRVTVLGAGDAFGSGGRRNSSYLVESDGRRILLDCGPTVLAGLKEAGVATSSVDAVVLSHLHGDHFGGLPFLVLEYTYESPRQRELLIVGPAPVEERFQALYRALYSEISGQAVPFPLRFLVHEAGRPLEVAGLTIEPIPVPHQRSESSFALKVRGGDGTTLLYSGDSAWTDEFVRQTGDVDLFLCECTYWSDLAPVHVNYGELMRNLARLGARRIVLTHLGSSMLERLDEVELETAHDGLVLEVTPAAARPGAGTGTRAGTGTEAEPRNGAGTGRRPRSSGA